MFEEASQAASGAAPEPIVVSRFVQATIGLATTLVVLGVAFGGALSMAYATVQGRLGELGARATAALVALGGFVGVHLLPSFKYPANPPAIGDPATIDERTLLYAAMVVISLLVVIAGSMMARLLTPRTGGWNAALLASGAGLTVLVSVSLALPSMQEAPTGFPADVLWHFRVASLAVQASMWATIGLLFGALTERNLQYDARTPALEAPAAAAAGG